MTTSRSFVRLLVAALICALLAAACSREEQNRIKNVKPPRPGTPASGAEITGIYRSLDLSVLQIRANGTYNLVTQDDGATTGQYTLSDGKLEVISEGCGDAVGRYTMSVTGKQEAGKAQLQIAAVDEPCATRIRALADRSPWVYSDS